MSKIYRTSQHKSVLETLVNTGRYVLDPEFVCNELRDDDTNRSLVLEPYNWLASAMPTRDVKPADAEYPVWLSLNTASNYPAADDGVIIELEIPDEFVAMISVEKWSRILDYRYIPADAADERRHLEMMAAYGVSDTQACMSNFYPDLKRDIMASWSRVFDVADTPDEMCYGLVWELRKEWIK